VIAKPNFAPILIMTLFLQLNSIHNFSLDIVLEYYVLSGWYPASVALLEVQASGVPEAG
jgi:hypothetical protein